ncbi:OmpA family protein [Buchnera aphidicola]|uniref:OmpA family protein n=1 Tax=Buchnera aphidicola TaxID=9 RepID=UPI0031B88FB1
MKKILFFFVIMMSSMMTPVSAVETSNHNYWYVGIKNNILPIESSVKIQEKEEVIKISNFFNCVRDFNLGGFVGYKFNPYLSFQMESNVSGKMLPFLKFDFPDIYNYDLNGTAKFSIPLSSSLNAYARIGTSYEVYNSIKPTQSEIKEPVVVEKPVTPPTPEVQAAAPAAEAPAQPAAENEGATEAPAQPAAENEGATESSDQPAAENEGGSETPKEVTEPQTPQQPVVTTPTPEVVPTPVKTDSLKAISKNIQPQYNIRPVLAVGLDYFFNPNTNLHFDYNFKKILQDGFAPLEKSVWGCCNVGISWNFNNFESNVKNTHINTFRPILSNHISHKKNIVNDLQYKNKKFLNPNFEKTILFPSKSFTLSQNSKNILENLVKQIKKYNLNQKFIEITGYSDQLGLPEENQKLSEKRAQIVADFLHLNNFPIKKMFVRGLGSTSFFSQKTNSIIHNTKNLKNSFKFDRRVVIKISSLPRKKITF